MTDRDIWKLNRGGHDPHKVYAAYHTAMQNKGTPTVILAKTIKGYGMGKSGESMNTTHQQKKLDEEDLLYYRDRFDVPLTDEQVKNIEYFLLVHLLKVHQIYLYNTTNLLHLIFFVGELYSYFRLTCPFHSL